MEITSAQMVAIALNKEALANLERIMYLNNEVQTTEFRIRYNALLVAQGKRPFYAENVNDPKTVESAKAILRETDWGLTIE